MSFSAGPSDEILTPITISVGVHGTLRGVEVRAADNQPKCRRFCQIPFALPPSGEYRWRPPRAVPSDLSWENVNGEDFGNITCQPTYHIQRPGGPSLSTVVAGRQIDEDSLTVNVWTPTGAPPAGGWPVYTYLHGGWLQIGNPAITDKNNPADLMMESGLQVVIVAVAYRLSLFGFLASKEIAAENENGCAGNFGFLDQRMGMEWVVENVHHFGGNPDNITLGGPSAGAYSTHFQMCYEMNFPVKQIFKRTIQYSNAIPAQPKTIEESQAAFDGLLTAFGISLELDGKEKMRRLRGLGAQEIMDKIMELKIHTFRAVTDGAFVHEDTMQRLLDGTSAREFKRRNLSIIIGEVDKEELLYSCTNPPNTIPELRTQLLNYYKVAQVNKIMSLYSVPPTASSNVPELQMAYGKMVADGQVYVPSRLFIKTLFDNGVGMDRILRYRLCWKPQAMQKIEFWPKEVTHSDDTWAWWYSKRYGFTPEDCAINKAWLAPVAAFYAGDVAAASAAWWGPSGAPPRPDAMRLLRDGKIRLAEDDRWERCLRIAEAVRDDVEVSPTPSPPAERVGESGYLQAPLLDLRGVESRVVA